MLSQKSLFKPNILLGKYLILPLILLLSLIITSVNSRNVSAISEPDLSVSLSNFHVNINGNQVVNSVNQFSESSFSLLVDTNNKTGYTATINTTTDNTALIDVYGNSNSQIDSIDQNYPFGSFPNNTWGFRLFNEYNYRPIPTLSSPVSIIHTNQKTNGNDEHEFNIGIKLDENLESGRYENQLVFSVITNPFTPKAVMGGGLYFHSKIGSLDPDPGHLAGYPEQLIYQNLKHFKRSLTAPASGVNTVNIEDEYNSEAEIKAWYDASDQTVYYYTVADKVFLNSNSNFMFNYFTKMIDLDLLDFDTSEVEDMGYMFYGMNSLTNLNIAHFNTSKVKNMNSMFANLSAINQLDLSHFDTSNVENMEHMFDSFKGGANTLNISNFNTSKVKNMSGMFAFVTGIQSLNLANFDTSNVTDMSEMFYGADNLQSLNVTSFNTGNVENMSRMFSGIDNIVELDLSSFRTPKVKDFNRMFEAFSESKLQKIYASADFDISSVYTPSTNPERNMYIFNNLYNLVGGGGSRNLYRNDLSWLRIDDPVRGRIGYFTRKP